MSLKRLSLNISKSLVLLKQPHSLATLFFKSKNSAFDYMIVGLGNPGMQYEDTRHNAGFMAIDLLAKSLNVEISKHKFDALYCDCKIGDKRILLLKPQTYMNNSGRAVKQLMAKYKIPEENLLVIYDDYDLPKGKIRILRKCRQDIQP